MSINNDVSGAAALAICESLLVFHGDRKNLPEPELIGNLENAITAQKKTPADDGMTKMHEAVSALIKGIIDGGNSVRRPA